MLKVMNGLAVDWLNRQRPGVHKQRRTEDDFINFMEKAEQEMETNELDEALKKGPRLCWVWNSIGNRYMEIVVRKQSVHNWHRYITESGAMFERAELVRREEIEKYLGDK